MHIRMAQAVGVDETVALLGSVEIDGVPGGLQLVEIAVNAPWRNTEGFRQRIDGDFLASVEPVENRHECRHLGELGRYHGRWENPCLRDWSDRPCTR